MRVPVLIVGGGPVGLSLAIELGRRGIEALLVEQSGPEVEFTTANLVNTRTVEHLRRWGIAGAVRHSGFPADQPRAYRYITSFAGHELAAFERPANGSSDARSPHSPESRLWCPKVYFDPILRGTAFECPSITLRYRTRFEKFEQTDTGVRAWLTDAEGRTEVVEADYLAGCDGGKSEVRKQLGIGLSGQFAETRNVAITVRAPLAEHRRVGQAVYYGLVGPRARGVVTSVDGADEWRINVWHDKNYELSRLDAEQVCRRALGDGVPFEVLSSRGWAGHCVVADSYGTDRVFLVGDAAHLPWPAGGFGMNTGLGDAVDLGWKLAALVEGWAGPAMARSYAAERRPIGLRNIAYAQSLHRDDTRLAIPPDLDADTPEAAAARADLSARIQASRGKEFGLESPEMELGYTYANSPILPPTPASRGSQHTESGASAHPPVCSPARLGVPTPPTRGASALTARASRASEPGESGVRAEEEWRQSSAVGCRAPHGWISEGRSTLDLFGTGFRLLCFDGEPAPRLLGAAAAQGVPMRATRLYQPELARLYERRLVLVRPDGHVAWRGDTEPDDPFPLVDTIRGAR
ncbi:FAD-dependent monooxygenase [Pseudonocardia spinosispora]|uniref:FAD-dependent monooxygenase n=1 Tax=Pseudonocardia spinosispora TaxID=103441 RepID=UPI00040DF8CA|nr:FAD-dependent monooxygenase [Pseudonocardia spinosispora]